MTTIHLAFGPVQEFVAQARRARDLWAGSYLLSFLAASALAAANEHDDVAIVMPALEGNPLWQAVRGGWQALSPQQREIAARAGSVPHVAELSAPSPEQAATVARAAVQGWTAAWQQVANAVRDYLGRSLRLPWDAATDAIWNRQIGDAWTQSWTVTDDRAAAGRRKSLRAFALRPEPGEKCTCCGLRQALHDGRGDGRAHVIAYWKAARGARNQTDLQEDGKERLCAVCAVKRFYPYVARQALGWEVATTFPSTTAFASFAWREELLKQGKDDAKLRAAVQGAVTELHRAGQGPQAVAFPRLADLAATWGEAGGAARDFLGYEAEWFDPDTVTNAREAAAALAGEAHLPQREAVAGAARSLRMAARAAGLGNPGADYALLVMDGDRMGELMRNHPTQTSAISQALGAFSAKVRKIVEDDHDGRLIYAGGDDVLAMLPKERALPAARKLREEYETAFPPGVRATISAGLLFAHEQTPLRSVIRAGHSLLEETAKERGGRDAIAISLRQRGGAALTFAAKWDSDAVTKVEHVAENVRGGAYSRGFLYDLQNLLPVAATLPAGHATELLAADFMQGERRKRDGAGIDVARERVQALLALAPVSGTGERWDVIRLALWLAGPGKGDR